jgi:hypothetical protein
MIYEQELLKKKEKLEKVLATGLNWLEKERQWLKEAEALKEGDEDFEDKEIDIGIWKDAIERDELITEALQDEIDAIDSELRNSGILREPDLKDMLKVKNRETAVPAIEDLPGYEEYREEKIQSPKDEPGFYEGM